MTVFPTRPRHKRRLNGLYTWSIHWLHVLLEHVVRPAPDVGLASDAGGIAPKVRFRSAGHDLGRADMDEGADDIGVEDGEWLKAACVVRQGVRIGGGAVVAARAFLTRDTSAHAIVGRVPAKAVRSRGVGL